MTDDTPVHLLFYVISCFYHYSVIYCYSNNKYVCIARLQDAARIRTAPTRRPLALLPLICNGTEDPI